MTITRIENQKKNKDRFSVYIDEKFSFGIDGVDLLYYKLKEGMDLPSSLYEEITERVFFVKARDAAIRYLGLSLKTENDLRERLKRYEYPESIIENVIETMKKYGYIDDEKYSNAFISSKMKNNLGKHRIFQELMQKKINRDIIERCMAESFDNECQIDSAVSAIEKKMKGYLPEDYKEKKRLFDFLARRGFSFDIIKKAYKIYSEEDLYDEGFDDFQGEDSF